MATKKIIGVIALLSFMNCAFIWEPTTVEKCGEAKKLVAALAKIDASDKRQEIEDKIVDLCADGPAGHYVRGLRQERDGKIDEAIEEYRETLKIDSQFSRASGNLGLLLVQKGLPDEAVVELTKGVQSDPDPLYHKGLARIFSERKIYPLASYHYKEAIKGLPNDASLHADFAELYKKMESSANAEEEYRRALAIDAGNLDARLGLAALYLARDNNDKAIAELKQAQLANPQNKQVHRLLAEAYEKSGDRKAADYEYLLAGEQRGVLPTEFLRRGDDLLKAKEYDKAIAEFRSALKEKPNSIPALQKLGEACMAAGRDDEAIAAYKELLKLKGDNGDAQYSLGVLYERKGLLDEAVVAYRQALQVAPDNGDARRRLADIYTLRGSFAQAIEQYRELVKKTGGNPLIHFKLARVYVNNKNVKEAINSYQEAIKLDPDNLEAHRELANLYRKGNAHDLAEKQFKEVLRLKKDDAEARNMLTAIYVKNKNYESLITLLKEGVELQPKDPANHYKLGLIYEFQKDYPAALEQYKASVDLKSDYAKALNAQGRVLLKTGRLNEAKEALEAAKKADPDMEETAVLLSNIRDEMTPSNHKSSKKSKKSRKGKKGKGSKKESKSGKGTKGAKSGKSTKKKKNK